VSLAAALFLALAAAAGWSLFDLLRRLLAARVAALPLVALVTLGALPPLVAWTWIAGDWRLAPGYLLPAAASVVLNVAANFAYFRSLQLAPISVTLPLLSLTPAFAALLAWGLLGEGLAWRQIAGVALVVLGALALSTHLPRRAAPGSVLQTWRSHRGSLLMAAVALCWSVTLLLDKVALRYAAPTLHALVLNAGVAGGALMLLAARREIGGLAVPRRVVLLLAGSILCGVVTLTAQLAALSHLGVALIETLKRGVGSTLALVWGRAFFAEPLGAAKLGAVAVMIAGVVLLLV